MTVTIREYRPPSAFNATPDEARRLLGMVQSAYPTLATWEPRRGRDGFLASADDLEREFMRQFRAAMFGLSTIQRRSDVDYGYAFDFWLDTVETQNRLLDVSVSISGRPFMAAVVASGDIPFTAWWTSGAERALGLKIGGEGRRSEAWRKILSGEIAVPKPVAARTIREAQPSQVRFFAASGDEMDGSNWWLS